MEPKQVKLIVRLALAVFVVWLFFGSSLPSRGQFVSEHNSNELALQVEIEKNSNYRKIGLNYKPNTIARLPNKSTVRQQLSYQFPYESKNDFPKIIWQTWKVGVQDARFPDKYLKLQQSWEELNENYKHYVLSDEQCNALINDIYGPVPDVLYAYNSLPKSILKADFFRYLILYSRGGVYSDIDTQALKPIDTWKSMERELYGKPASTGIAIGVEADAGGREDWRDWYAREIQFCQWTIQSKPGHPVLRELIANITDQTLTRKKKGQLTTILGKDEGGDIMNWTGPGIFTDAVFSYMNNIMQSDDAFETKKYKEIITPKFFTKMEQPYLIDDVMILPITSFSPDVGQMGSKSSKDEMAYSKHVFSGSWKPENERMGK